MADLRWSEVRPYLEEPGAQLLDEVSKARDMLHEPARVRVEGQRRAAWIRPHAGHVPEFVDQAISDNQTRDGIVIDIRHN